MEKNLSVPHVQPVTATNSAPALLLSVGPAGRWPVLIGPGDFAMVTETTGYHAWGFQRGNVVVGDPSRPGGRRSVAKIIASISGTQNQAVYRDGNPLNLLRENIGLRRAGGVFWIVPRPGEPDPIHFGGAIPNRTPQAILAHRPLVRPPRDPAMAGLRAADQHWTQRGA